MFKLNFNTTPCLTADKLEEIMKGHLSYYGLNSPDTLINFIGSTVPGIQRYKILSVPMEKVYLYHRLNIINSHHQDPFLFIAIL